MDQSSLAQWLQQSFVDRHLENDEKIALRNIALPLSSELRRFARNRAFDQVQQALATGDTDASASLRWLEQVIRTLDATAPDPVRSQAHFSPGNACRNAIVDCLHQAQRSVDICVFTLSDDRISDAVLKTHHRGIRVRIISDNDKCNDEGSDVDLLRRQGVPVRIDDTPYHMHHKFALFDGDLLLNGSFNWTRSASELNHENILVTSDAGLVAAFARQFEDLWERFA